MMTILVISMGFGRDREAIGPRPSQLFWDERDIGQKFSIVMLHLMLAGLLGFFGFLTVREAEGAAWAYVAVAFVGTLALWFLWRNWSNRNAR